jgi:hypothetical protein
VQKLKDHRIVIDGIRQRSTLEQIRAQSEGDVAIIYVHAPPDIAYSLYSQREQSNGGTLTPTQFYRLYAAPVELEVRYMIQDADAVVYNWTGKQEYDVALDKLATTLSLYPKRTP